MNIVFALLTFQCLLGAFDNLWHHELEADLPHEPGARTELALHTARELLYGLIFGSIAWLRWQGFWCLVLVAILLAEIVITLSDFVIEDRTRRLPPLERVLHTVLALSYGATLAAWSPTLHDWLLAPTAMAPSYNGVWSWLMSLFAVGVGAWGLRDLFAVARLGVPEWQRHPMHAGSAATPRVVLVTGATGFIGRALVRRLVSRGDHVIALSRRVARAQDQFGPWVEVCSSLAGIGPHRQIDAIVNLAGAPVVGPWWTAARRRQLIGSRLQVTAQIIDLIRRLERKPSVLVSGSAVGFYGDRGDEMLDEGSGDRDGFLSELCRRWEAAAVKAERLGVRVCRLRIGLVLGRDGGVLQPLALSSGLGLGAVMGSGRQWLSWIHRDDLVRLIDEAIDHEHYRGVYNAVAPNACTQRDFSNALAAILRRPRWLRIPAFALRGLAGEMSDLFLISQRVTPRGSLRAGFEFWHPQLQGALSEILANPAASGTQATAASVYVNEDCIVCRTEMGHYRAAAERQRCAMTFHSVNQYAHQLSSYGLTPTDLRRRLFAVRADGELCSGVDAVIAIWRPLRGYRWLASLISLPILHALSVLVYDLICAPLLTWWNEGRQRDSHAPLPSVSDSHT